MEYLILGALLYSRIPDCPKPFVKTWQDNRAYALQHMPRKTCRYRTETGSYLCNKQGCNRP